MWEIELSPWWQTSNKTYFMFLFEIVFQPNLYLNMIDKYTVYVCNRTPWNHVNFCDHIYQFSKSCIIKTIAYFWIAARAYWSRHRLDAKWLLIGQIQGYQALCMRLEYTLCLRAFDFTSCLFCAWEWLTCSHASLFHGRFLKMCCAISSVRCIYFGL